MRASASAARNLSNGISSYVQTQGVRPSRHSLRRGILVPGDGPPQGATGTFLDYREVLLPAQLTALQKGILPLGGVQDPGRDQPDFPIGLEWGFVERHVAVIGPSGSGKTYGILAPWTVAACASGLTTVAVDVKGDLHAEIRAAKVRLGVTTPIPTGIWDIDNPHESRPWSPLSEVSTPQHAAQLALAFLGEIDPRDSEKYFAERDHRWLRGLAWLAVNALGHDTHPSVLFKLIVSQSYLASLASQAPQASHELLDLIQQHPSDFTKATAGLANKLSWLAEPGLADMLDARSPKAFTLAQALGQGVLLIVGARERGGERSATAAAVMLNLLRLRCMERFGTNQVPVFWVLDEARRYAKRIQLDQMLDLLRGAGSPVCVAVQDVAHFGSEEDQSRMLTNCDTFITLTGVSPDTASFFSRRLGKVSSPTTTMAMDASGAWRPTIGHAERPLLGEREIMYPPVGRYGGVAQLRSGSPRPFLFSL